MISMLAGSESQPQPVRRAIEHKKNCKDEDLHGNYDESAGCPDLTVLSAISLGCRGAKLKDAAASVREASTVQDEHAVFIRTVSSADEGKLRSMFSRLSLETVYRRFHTPYPQVPERMAKLFTKVDRFRRGVVAVVGNEIVGHAMHVRLENGTEAEFAVIVEDEWQSKGVGKLLLSELAEEAKRQGIETFTGIVLGENRRVLGLLDSVFAGARHTLRDGIYKVSVPLRSLDPVTVLKPEGLTRISG